MDSEFRSLLDALVALGTEVHGQGACVIAARDGEILTSSIEATAAREKLRDLPATAFDAAGELQLGHVTWRLHRLHLGSQQNAAELYIGAPRDSQTIARQFPAEARQLMTTVCAAFEHGWNREETINSMAFELGNRYEELNLIFGIDSSLNDDEVRSIRGAAVTVIENCLDFLNIDGIGLVIPAQGIEIFRDCDSVEQVLDFTNPDSAGAALMRDLADSRRALVLNGSAETPPGYRGQNLPYKSLAAPLVDDRDGLSGALFFFRSLEAESFSTGDRKMAEVVAGEIQKLIDARYDAVSGFFNRAAFESSAAERIARLTTEQRPSALLLCDIDRFGLVNEACGREAGDRLLRQVAQILRRNADSTAVLGRVGGDQFALLISGRHTQDLHDYADALARAVGAMAFRSREKQFDVSLSVGVAEMNTEQDLNRAFNEAEIACLAAKELGGNCARVFSADDLLRTRHEQKRIAATMRSAIEHERFELFAQGIFPVTNGTARAHHFEILLRLLDEDGQYISPAQFIPAAERYRVIGQIDRMVVRGALTMLAEAQAAGLDVGFSINLSGASVANLDFCKFVTDTIRQTDVATEGVTFEITETTAVSDFTTASAFIAAIRETGCSFSLDDFGAGMSSYAYLRDLPVEYVKIDGAFVRDLTSDPYSRAVVESIHQIARTCNKKTIAEFVENDEILSVLKEVGIDYAQGYGLDKPSPLHEKLAALRPRFARAG